METLLIIFLFSCFVALFYLIYKYLSLNGKKSTAKEKYNKSIEEAKYLSRTEYEQLTFNAAQEYERIKDDCNKKQIVIVIIGVILILVINQIMYGSK